MNDVEWKTTKMPSNSKILWLNDRSIQYGMTIKMLSMFLHMFKLEGCSHFTFGAQSAPNRASWT